MRASILTMTEEERATIVAAADRLKPRVLPAGWAMRDDHANAGWYRSTDGLLVCLAVEVVDGEFWAHLSFSRQDRDPSWFDTRRVKETFLGKKTKAIQVLPAEEEHYNFHPHCLHLYSCLGEDPLPDFRDAEGAL